VWGCWKEKRIACRKGGCLVGEKKVGRHSEAQGEPPLIAQKNSRYRATEQEGRRRARPLAEKATVRQVIHRKGFQVAP